MDIVLIQPEIPQNTGSIARTCAATKTPLHVVGQTPFELTEKRARRAGLDYWPYVNLTKHADWEEYYTANRPRKVWLLSKFGGTFYYDVQFGIDDALVFGNESSGLPEAFVAQFPVAQVLTIPMACPEVRSLNLSNAVSIVLYEARRQLDLDRESFEIRPRRTPS